MMSTTPNLRETVFSISGINYTIRPVRTDDFDTNLEQCRSLPETQSDEILFGNKLFSNDVNILGLYDFANHDAVGFVACRTFSNDKEQETSFEGVAFMAINPKLESHQFNISVKSHHRLNRLPKELMDMLINYAITHDIPTVFCLADEHNLDMRALAEKSGMSVRLMTDKTHLVKYSLFLDQHPEKISV